jgi:hypothetical protein
MEENKREVRSQFWQQQEKYVYYIIAISVSAIGFAIYKTSGQPLKLSQIPLGLAIISWGLSAFCGLRFLKYVISNLYANSAYLNEKNADKAKGIRKAMDLNSETASKYSNWQERLFYSGIILFIVWHIFEMYLINKQ